MDLRGLGPLGADRLVRPTRWLTALVWTLIWSGMTGFFDSVVFSSVSAQLRTWDYQQTQATVIALRSSGQNSHDPKLPKGAKVLYRYQVAGKTYEGTQVSPPGSLGLDSGLQLLKRLRKGQQVPVFYDPQNPDQAVLVRGVDPMEAWLVIFMLPFNCVMLGSWLFLLASPLKWIEPASRITVGLIVTGVGSFVSVFIVGALVLRPQPLVSAVTVLALAVFLVVLGVVTAWLAWQFPDSLWGRVARFIAQASQEHQQSTGDWSWGSD